MLSYTGYPTGVTPFSVYADKVTITAGNGTDLVTVSDVLISASLTDRLKITLGKGDDWLEFYDNTWDGYANLSRRWQQHHHLG